jgi:hypothetical protein
VGQCAVAQGKTDSKGDVTATRIELSPKTGSSCTTGAGLGGRGPGGAPGGAPGAPGSGAPGGGNG